MYLVAEITQRVEILNEDLESELRKTSHREYFILKLHFFFVECF